LESIIKTAFQSDFGCFGLEQAITMVLVISSNTPFSAMDPPAGNELSPELNAVKSRPSRQPEPPASAKALAAALVAQQSKDVEALDTRDG
jgi:hypothetical protein